MCYGYPVKSLVCLAEALRLKDIQPEQLEAWMLDLEFAVDTAWKSKQEVIQKSVNEFFFKDNVYHDYDWYEEWKEKHKNEPIIRDFYIQKERETK
jgi:hypothetical protein